MKCYSGILTYARLYASDIYSTVCVVYYKHGVCATLVEYSV